MLKDGRVTARRRTGILLILLTVAPYLAVAAQGPFAFETTPGKLLKTVVPRRYEIRLEPDLNSFVTRGSEVVTVDVLKPVSEIVFNALDLEISAAAISGGDGSSNAAQVIEMATNAAKQLVTLKLSRTILPGQYRLALDFSGRITEQAQGLFYVKYASPSGKKMMLATQMEPADARRMFPCWDEPVFRAVFELTVVVPEKHLAVSNMRIDQERQAGNGMKEVKFLPTPPMASYLVVLVSGELEELKGEAEGVALRVITTGGKREQGKYALDAAKKLLGYYNKYFGIKYPLPKLDLIAVPGGFDGAMENWGGITFEESSLLFEPGVSSLQTRQDIFITVAHEMSHQWFGNLVTMAWWDDLWLNEGFASWMENKATDHFNPDWDIWLAANAEKNGAMNDDARPGTHAIQSAVDNESEATDAFDSITYQKGEAFVRMLEDYLGEAQFQKGIQRYLAAHQYSNTTTADLWKALQEASGKPIEEMASGWTEQPGFPVVMVEGGGGDGDEHSTSNDKAAESSARLTLVQERFTVNDPDAEAEWWKIPISWSDLKHPKEQKHLLLETTNANEGETLRIPAGDVVQVNPGGIGFYRVAYDTELTERLVHKIAGLPAAGQLTLLSDSWAMVEAGRGPVTNYLALVEQMQGSQVFAIWDQMITTLEAVDGLEQGLPERAQFRAYARGLLGKQWRRLGWDARRKEKPGDQLLRNRIIGALGHFGDEAVVAEANRRFEKFLRQPDSLDEDIRPAVLNIVGRSANRRTYDALHKLAREADGTEERQQYYRAMTMAQDAALARETLAIALTDETVPQEAANLVAQVAVNGEHTDLAWQFTKVHVKELLAKVDSFSRNDYLPSILEACSDPAYCGELTGCARENVSEDALSRAGQTASEIRFRAALKKYVVPEIAGWIRQKMDSAGR